MNNTPIEKIDVKQVQTKEWKKEYYLDGNLKSQELVDCSHKTLVLLAEKINDVIEKINLCTGEK